MSYNPKKLFNQIQKKEQENASGQSAGNFGNPLLFKPKVGTTYSIRLLWLSPEEGYDREYPMINSYIRRIWDENATSGSKDIKVICPTSQYMLGETPSAFKKCPICAAASDFYKKGQEGSDSAKELYDKFRRTCVGYVPIYIVNGPEEDIGQIRILQYGKQFKDFFDAKIFGIKKQNRNGEAEDMTMLEEDIIGLDAFMYYDETQDSIVTKGYNLIITTTTKPMNIRGKKIDMPQYALDFTRKLSTVSEIDGVELDSDQGVKYFNCLNSKVLHFDKDFYIKSTDEELQNFKLDFITKESVNEEVDNSAMRKPPIKPPVKSIPVVEDVDGEDDNEDEIPMHFNKKKATPTRPVIEEDEDISVNIPRTSSGDLDVDSLVNDLIN